MLFTNFIMMLVVYKNNLIITFIPPHVVSTSAIKLIWPAQPSLSFYSLLSTSHKPESHFIFAYIIIIVVTTSRVTKNEHHLVIDVNIKHSALLVCYMSVHALR